MQTLTLGKTGLTVSEICLGTMTWGTQNTEAEGHAQADMAVDHGVTFWDTAEMYPVNPVSAETVGRTEAIIGTWLAARGGRDRLVLASKVTGAGHPEIRGGEALSGPVMRAAVERSLQRLQTDYIDIYQLHWSNRGAYHFRDIWTFDPRGTTREVVEAHMLEMLEVAAELIAAGKIRAIALSNETVWGAAKWLSLAEAHGLPRMVSVQNEYSLMCRQFDSDWAEFSVLEEMPLLAFSTLATGLLSGKYAGNAVPAGSRRTLNPGLSGRLTPQAHAAVAAYVAIAAAHGLDPCQMAIAFCMARPFPVIPIIGASSTAQLATAIGAGGLHLPTPVLAAIDAAHRAHPQPF